MATLQTIRRGKRTRRADHATGVPRLSSIAPSYLRIHLGTAVDDKLRDFELVLTRKEAKVLALALIDERVG